jgi:hypothetical protein
MLVVLEAGWYGGVVGRFWMWRRGWVLERVVKGVVGWQDSRD